MKRRIGKDAGCVCVGGGDGMERKKGMREGQGEGGLKGKAGRGGGAAGGPIAGTMQYI